MRLLDRLLLHHHLLQNHAHFSNQNPLTLMEHLLALRQHLIQGMRHEPYQKYAHRQLKLLFPHHSWPFFRMFLLYPLRWLADQGFRQGLVDSHKSIPFEQQQEDYLILFHLCICY